MSTVEPTPTTAGVPPISATPTIKSPQSTDSSKLYILLVLLIISVSFISSTK